LDLLNMKTTDLFKNNRSSKKINESMEKMFGQRLDLQSFDLPKLEDARNKLRTQISQVRSESGFNENLENDAYTKAQFMLDAINAEIAEREEFIADPSVAEVEEGFGSMEERVQELLKRFDSDMNEIGGYGDPDFKEIIQHLKNGDAESAAEVVWYAYYDQDGGELRNMDGYVDDLQAEFEELVDGGDQDEPEGSYDSSDDADALASAGHGSDEDYGSFGYDESIEEKAPPGAKAERMVKHIKKGYAKDGKLTDKEKSIAYATAWKQHNKEKNESIESGEDMTTLREGEVQQASAIVTAKTMVDRVSRWIEELSGMENDTLLQLGDQIRDEMGQDLAKSFISATAPAIQQALENLKQTRETLATGVRTLTGEEQGAEMLGAEPGAEGGDELGAAEPDMMNTGDEMGAPEEGGDDEFGAADAAAGGLEAAGREQRESIDRSNRLLKVLAG
jgi:hypothetical protein